LKVYGNILWIKSRENYAFKFLLYNNRPSTFIFTALWVLDFVAIPLKIKIKLLGVDNLNFNTRKN